MEIAPDYLKKFQPAAVENRPRNEREEMLDRFLAKLNPVREKEGFKPMPYARLAFLLQGIPTADLYAFYRECERARNFGSFFWWSFRAPRHPVVIEA